jgi:hypothetical protein
MAHDYEFVRDTRIIVKSLAYTSFYMCRRIIRGPKTFGCINRAINIAAGGLDVAKLTLGAKETNSGVRFAAQKEGDLRRRL